MTASVSRKNIVAGCGIRSLLIVGFQIVYIQDSKFQCTHHQTSGIHWLGGHADGDHDLLAVALREAQEESGLSTVRAVSPELFSVEILTVDGHEKRGHYVPSHLHLNVTYLLEADPALPIRCKPDENSRVGWFGLDEAVAASSEPWFRERIYSKLNAKLCAGWPK